MCCVVTFHEGSVRERAWGGYFLLLLPVVASYDASNVLATTSVVDIEHAYLRPAASDEGLHLSPNSAANPTELSNLVDRGNLSLIPKDDVEVVSRSSAGLLLRIHLGGPTESPVHQVTRVAVYY